jgi:hypothetical protein
MPPNPEKLRSASAKIDPTVRAGPRVFPLWQGGSHTKTGLHPEYESSVTPRFNRVYHGCFHPMLPRMLLTTAGNMR